MLLILYVCWIIFNGNLTLEIALLGIPLTGLVYAFMCKFLNWSIKRDLYLFCFTFYAFDYLFTLLIEIIKATIATIKMTFGAREEICPALVYFDSPIESKILKVVLANSITLTPGTITVNLTDDLFIVHALDESFAVDIDKSIFVEKLMKIEAYSKKLGGKKYDA